MSDPMATRPVRDQIAELARTQRELLQRRQREIMSEYLGNAGEIARLQGVELAAGITMERDRRTNLRLPEDRRMAAESCIREARVIENLDLPEFARARGSEPPACPR